MSRFAERFIEQGKLEGREEGREEGRREEGIALLERQLARRFGPLPETVRARLQAATLDQIDAWSLRLLDADELEDVFRG